MHISAWEAADWETLLRVYSCQLRRLEGGSWQVDKQQNAKDNDLIAGLHMPITTWDYNMHAIREKNYDYYSFRWFSLG